MATVVMWQSLSHCARDSKLRVKVPKTRTNCSSRSSGTATYIWLSPTSIPAALRLICLRASRRTILLPASSFFSLENSLPYAWKKARCSSADSLSVWNSSNGVYATNTKTENSRDQPNLRALDKRQCGVRSSFWRTSCLFFIARDKIQGVSLKQNRAKPDGRLTRRSSWRNERRPRLY